MPVSRIKKCFNLVYFNCDYYCLSMKKTKFPLEAFGRFCGYHRSSGVHTQCFPVQSLFILVYSDIDFCTRISFEPLRVRIANECIYEPQRLFLGSSLRLVTATASVYDATYNKNRKLKIVFPLSKGSVVSLPSVSCFSFTAIDLAPKCSGFVCCLTVPSTRKQKRERKIVDG